METNLQKSIGTWEVTVAGVALVVAASTLVSDFTGYFQLGIGFAISLLFAFGINLLLGISAADLSVSYPRAGALYEFIKEIIKGKIGQMIATLVAITFLGVLAFGLSGETAAGAFGLQALVSMDVDMNLFIVLLVVAGAIPNIFGIKTTAWLNAGLLLLMLGIRWAFGLAGFFGVGETGTWSFDNLLVSGGINWFGTTGIITAGLALAFWSFVGIEFACSLAEEVKSPRKSLPKGIIFGLFGILLTSLIMGLGVTGTLPLGDWQHAVASELGQNGNAPQLAVGYLMFGKIGYLLMALASVAATLGSLSVALAAFPRLIYSLARDNNFFGPLSKIFGKLHPKFKTPINAILLCSVILLVPALFSSAVVDWLYSAAYIWIVIYIVYHILAIINRYQNPEVKGIFSNKIIYLSGITGIVATSITLYFAFLGGHGLYGKRALIVLGIASLFTLISFALKYFNKEKYIYINENKLKPQSVNSK